MIDILCWIPALVKGLLILAGTIDDYNSFPKPLSKKEETECLDAMAKGDDEARNKLIKHNLRLVVHVSKKYTGSAGIDQEDMYSIGNIGLIKGINSFNPQRNTKLATYVAKCIENEILMELRKRRNKPEVHIQHPIGIDKEGNEINLLDILGTECDMIPEMVDLKMNIVKLYKAIDKVLNDRERLVLELHYGLLNSKIHTQREIGNVLSISRSYVSRIEKKAVNKLSMEFYINNNK